jgi:tetratricopeptide (TPR) repeat protein
MRNLFFLIIVLACLTAIACGGRAVVEPGRLATTAGSDALSEGAYWSNRGCEAAALDYFLAAHAYFSAADHLDGVARSLNNLGNAYRALGDPEAAVLLYDEAVSLSIGMADDPGRLQALSNKAAALIDLERYAEANGVIAEAERIAAGAGLVFLPLLKNKAVWHVRQREFAEAEVILRQVAGKMDGSDERLQAGVNHTLGHVLMNTGRSEEAGVFLEKALSADRAAGNYLGLADDLAALGILYAGLGQDGKAAEYCKRSAKIYALLGRREAAGQQMEALANLRGGDGGVTRHFVERWLDDGTAATLCN